MFKDKVKKKNLKFFFLNNDMLDDISFKTSIEQLISFNSKTNI